MEKSHLKHEKKKIKIKKEKERKNYRKLQITVEDDFQTWWFISGSTAVYVVSYYIDKIDKHSSIPLFIIWKGKWEKKKKVAQ